MRLFEDVVKMDINKISSKSLLFTNIFRGHHHGRGTRGKEKRDRVKREEEKERERERVIMPLLTMWISQDLSI